MVQDGTANVIFDIQGHTLKVVRKTELSDKF